MEAPDKSNSVRLSMELVATSRAGDIRWRSQMRASILAFIPHRRKKAEAGLILCLLRMVCSSTKSPFPIS